MKIICLFLLTAFAANIVAAQKDYKQAVDQLIAQKGANLFINADKTLLEPNESARLSVGMLVFNDKDFIPGDETPPLTPPDEEILPPENQLYKAENWKILEGGGNIIGIDDTTITYTAPSKFPPEKLAVISVDLVPKLPRLPKVVLIQKIYLTLNENSFVLNLPQIGAANAKYVSERETAANNPLMPKIDSRAAARMSPAQREAMEKAQAQMQQQQQSGAGINISAVTSNAMAIYDANNNQTAIQLTKLAQQANDGKATGQKTGIVSVTFNFKGKGAGSYSLNDKDTGFGIRLAPLLAAGCGVHSEIDREFLCNGTIHITEVTEKTISGTLSTTVWTSVGKAIYRGRLYGKFTVNRAN